MHSFSDFVLVILLFVVLAFVMHRLYEQGITEGVRQMTHCEAGLTAKTYGSKVVCTVESP